MTSMDLAAYLDTQLRAVGIPIIGVRVGSPTDRSTWIVQFDPSATQAQKDQAATILAGLVFDAATNTDQDAKAQLDNKAVKALAIWVAQKLGIALATMKAEVLAIYKSLP